jgi:hypothetical protein
MSDLPWGIVDRLLQAAQRAEIRYQDTTSRWEDLFFAGHAPGPGELAQIEEERERAAQTLMAVRAYVFPLRLARKLPPVSYDVTSPQDVESAHSHRLRNVKVAFPVPEQPNIQESHPVEGGYGDVNWLEWPSPMGDTARARVYTPRERKDPPTLIYLHGIGMEMEMWRAQSDPVNALARDAGIRVVRPEAAWHGRRMLPGYHGGEPALAFAPKGYIDMVQGWLVEVMHLIRWARATSRGPVAIGGLSLGALTAQLVGTAARIWPRELQPEVMFLVVTSGDMLEVCFEGALPKGLGLLDALWAGGWTHEELARWRGLLEPQGDPVMPAERVVMLLGSHDSVTPYSGGLALARRWGVPGDNLFVVNRGHFSTPLGLHQDKRPVQRMAALLNDASGV